MIRSQTKATLWATQQFHGDIVDIYRCTAYVREARARYFKTKCQHEAVAIYARKTEAVADAEVSEVQLESSLVARQKPDRHTGPPPS